MSTDARHPRDRFITVLGRKPVLVALEDTSLCINKVVLVHNCRADIAQRIVDAARLRGVPVERASEAHITKLARNSTQHQGVIADVDAPRMEQLSDWLAREVHNVDVMTHVASHNKIVMVLSGLSNPANVGMILRSAEAAGISGVVLPRVGSPDIDPTVIKASAGVAFHATILRCPSDAEALTLLADAGFDIIGLDADESAESLYLPFDFTRHIAFVLGNESTGIPDDARAQITNWRSIPMPGRAESLNAAVAASLAIFEAVRQRTCPSNDTRR